MKNKLLLIICLTLFSFSILSAQTADEILNKHFTAVGYKKMADVNTITITGKITGDAVKRGAIEYLVKKVRPYKQYMELKSNSEVSKSIFDGRTEWTITKDKTVKNPFDVEEQRKRAINFEGELYYCKNNNYTIEYLGINKIEGLGFHLIKVTNKDGYDASFYIDPESFMLMKSSNGSLETYYGNFKVVDGITFPFSIRVLSPTGDANDLDIDTIELNKEVDPNLFIR